MSRFTAAAVAGGSSVASSPRDRDRGERADSRVSALSSSHSNNSGESSSTAAPVPVSSFLYSGPTRFMLTASVPPRPGSTVPISNTTSTSSSGHLDDAQLEALSEADADAYLQKVGGVRCYWSLMRPRYPRPDVPGSKLELEFLHPDPVLGAHLAKQKMSLMGRGVIEFIHPHEREREFWLDRQFECGR